MQRRCRSRGPTATLRLRVGGKWGKEGISGNKEGSQLGLGSLKNFDRSYDVQERLSLGHVRVCYWVQAPVMVWHHWPTLHIWCLDIVMPGALEAHAHGAVTWWPSAHMAIIPSAIEADQKSTTRDD